MRPAIFLLLMLNLLYIGLLPRLFFKKGRFHLLWWMTALPFAICSLILIACFVEYWKTWAILPDWVGESVATAASAFSIGLISFTLRTHRLRLALWHQQDAPQSIVTYGAYRYIRHPFYTSFLLALFGAFIFAPHWGTLLTLMYAVIILNYTAAQEERFLTESKFGEEYKHYLRRTGRFLPWFM